MRADRQTDRHADHNTSMSSLVILAASVLRYRAAKQTHRQTAHATAVGVGNRTVAQSE